VTAHLQRVKSWEIIADRLSKAGWSWGCVSAFDLEARTIWIVDAHGYGKRFIVRADEKLTAFVELERATRFASGGSLTAHASRKLSHRKSWSQQERVRRCPASKLGAA